MTSFHSRSASVFALFALGFASASAAAGGDAGLYPRPPANAAFVRIANAQPDGSAATATIGTLTFSGVKQGAASIYRPLRAGAYRGSFNNLPVPISLQPGNYYTIVVRSRAGANAVKAFADPTPQSKAKGLISLYNLSSQPRASLGVNAGSPVVIANVGSMSIGSRPVNPATAAFAVVGANGKVLATVPKQKIDRSAAYAVLLVDSAGGAKASWVRSETSQK